MLYVAATRGRDSLIIVGAPDGDKAPEWINDQGVSFTHDSRKYPPFGPHGNQLKETSRLGESKS